MNRARNEIRFSIFSSFSGKNGCYCCSPRLDFWDLSDWGRALKSLPKRGIILSGQSATRNVQFVLCCFSDPVGSIQRIQKIPRKYTLIQSRIVFNKTLLFEWVKHTTYSNRLGIIWKRNESDIIQKPEYIRNYISDHIHIEKPP